MALPKARRLRPRCGAAEMSDRELSIAGVARSLARTPEILRLVTADLSDADWRAHPAPERWSPLEILCHLRDEEQEDFGARLRVVLAGGGVFAPIRPTEWVTERRYRAEDPAQVRGEFERRRQDTLELVRSLRPSSSRRWENSRAVRSS